MKTQNLLVSRPRAPEIAEHRRDAGHRSQKTLGYRALPSFGSKAACRTGPHPEGDNIVLAHDVERAFTRNYGDLRVRFDGIRSFADSISS